MNIGPTNMKMKIEPLLFPRPLYGIEAFTTLRGNVDNTDPYSEYNLCHYTGDALSHMEVCCDSLCRILGIAPEHLIMPRQTHTASVVTINEDFFSLSKEAQQETLNEKDAIVTSLSGIAIGVNTADCVPIVLADAEKGIVAAVHAGWKGTIKRIASNTVSEMLRLGASPYHIQAAIGASICQDCFEVGDEVVEQFADAGFCFDEIAYRNSATGKAHISLQETNRLILLDCGIPSENIAISGNCTRCNPNKYFSARRLGINSGRTFTGIIRKL